MRKNRLNAIIAIIALILTICALLTSCRDDENEDDICLHENTVLQGQKVASCGETGYTGDYVCTACTAIVIPGEYIPTSAHTFDEGRVTKDATCMKTGITTYTCSGCGTTKTTVIQIVDHKDAYHDAQDGTHFHTCKTCLLNENAQHTPTDAGEYVASSCVEPAYTKYTCADCKGVYKVYSDTEPALGHDLTDWHIVDESTCSASGSKEQSCKREGCTYSHSVMIPENNVHNYVFSYYSIVPTCVEDGYAVYVCDGGCGNEAYREIAKTGIHSYIELESTGDGWVRKECSVCGDLISSYDASTLATAELKADAIDKDTALEMNMQSAAIQFPPNVVSQITSGVDVSVEADVLDIAKKNAAISNVTDEESRAVLALAPIYDFTVKVDNEVFRDTFSTKVAITVAYDNGDNDAEGIVIYYLAENGTIETITDVFYNAETKEVTFFVSHFSFYAVAYKETQEMRCKRGLHEYEATNTKVEADCFNFGYTLYECICCHRTTIDDIVEREEHRYGDLIDAKPSCERGDYITRVCQNEGCGHVLNVKLIGATGHTMDAPASCNTSSNCTKCGKMLSRPLGHQWTEWETVVEPSETTSGLRRRWCLTCGSADEATLVSIGAIDAIRYDSYYELVNVILGDIIDLDSGELTFVLCEEALYQTEATVFIQRTDKGYRIRVVGARTRFWDGKFEGWTSPFDLYYDNGVCVALLEDEDLNITEINNIIPMPMDIFKTVAEDIYAQLDDYVKTYFDLTREFIDNYSETLGEDINAILEDAGVPYTVEELDGVLDSIETVYAYLSLKLGYTTSQQLHGEIVLPSVEDYKKVLSALMASSVKDGVTTYTFAAAPLLDVADAILDFAYEHLNDTVAEFIYYCIKDEVLEYNADLTDFNAVVDFIAQEFPGTLTISDAVDKYVQFSEKNGFISLTNVYSLVNELVLQINGEEFDCEQFIKDNGDKCLNDLVKEMLKDEDATAEELYASVKEDAADYKIREIQINGETVEEYYEELRRFLDNTEITGDLSLSMDEEGRLVGLNVDHEFWAHYSLDPTEDVFKVESLKASVKRDDSVVVEIPESIRKSMSVPTTHYDSQGNLVIEGVDRDAEVNFRIEGYTHLPFDQVLEKDTAVTGSLGKDVYVLKPEYWHERTSVGDYYIVDGKYYTDSDYEYYSYAKIYEYTTLNDLVLELSAEPDVEKLDLAGVLAGTDIPVYYLEMDADVDYFYGPTYWGIIYQLDGEWMISTQYGGVYGSDDDEIYVTDEYSLAEFAKSLTVSSAKPYYRNSDSKICAGADLDGERYDVLNVSLAYGDGSRTKSVYGVMKDGELLLVTDYDGWWSNQYYTFTTPVEELPEYDTTQEYFTTVNTVDENGTLSTLRVKRVYLYKRQPTYYTKIADGRYVLLNSNYTRGYYDTIDKETITLPDGNILYVEGRTSDNLYGYRYGYETVYGYAKTVSGGYIQTALIVNGNETVDVLYRDAQSHLETRFNNLVDVNAYVTNVDGTYTVSAQLLQKLKAMCSDGGYYSIELDTEKAVGETSVYSMYYFAPYWGAAPDVNLDELFGNSPNGYSFWYDIFGGSYSNNNYYTVVHNDDGSITLIFPFNAEISNLYYNSFNIPLDDMLEYNEELSTDRGLPIYTYHGSYVGSNSTSYVYLDGKYYDYSTGSYTEYDLTLDTTTDFVKKGWRISSMYYCFDTVGGNGLPEHLRVYETTVYFGWDILSYSDPYFTVYTFYINGKIQVALGAKVTGESLLTFESYMPLDEYIASLEFVFDDDSAWRYGSIRYNGQQTEYYVVPISVYETDGQGNRISENYKYRFNVNYILNGSQKQYITDYSSWYYYNLTLHDEADLSEIPADATMENYTDTYEGVSYNMVRFSWKEEYTYTRNFIKLAGKYYTYDAYYYYDGYSYYNAEKLSQWSFENQAIGKVWYYLVEDEANDIQTYYTEFIPSDSGFMPSGTVVDPSSISGTESTKTLLGYTAEGYPLYEVVYLVDEASDEFEYTTETLADGTVFLHKDGMGYLKVTERYSTYYVRARKVTMADGTAEIFCFLRGAVISSGELSNSMTNSALTDYIRINGNTVTISEELLEVAAASGKNRFYLAFYCNYYYEFSYYVLESLFMMK